MKSGKLKFAIVFLAVALLARAHAAVDPDIYIFNKPFQVTIVTQSGIMYVPLEALAKALNLPEKIDGNTVVIGTPPASPAAGRVIVNGTVFNGAMPGDDGLLYVPLKSFVAACGDKMLYNRETQIIDVVAGDSLVTGAVERNSEQGGAALEAPPAASSTLVPPLAPAPKPAAQMPQKPQIPPLNLSAQIQSLREKYSKSLDSQSDLARYVGSMQAWADKQQSVMNRFQARLLQTEKRANQGNGAAQLADLFQRFGGDLSAAQRSFDQIVSPTRFQNSHALLRKGIDDGLPKLQSLCATISRLARALQNADSEQASSISAKFQNAGTRLSRIESEVEQNQSAYLHALEADLQNIR